MYNQEIKLPARALDEKIDYIATEDLLAATSDAQVADAVGSWNPTLMVGVFIPVPFQSAETSIPVLFRVELNMYVALRGIRVLDTANVANPFSTRAAGATWYYVLESPVQAMVGLYYPVIVPVGGTTAPNFVTLAYTNG